MKLSFFVDVFPGMKPEQVAAFSWPPTFNKSDRCTRYRIDVEIPDPQPDHVIAVEAKKVDDQ